MGQVAYRGGRATEWSAPSISHTKEANQVYKLGAMRVPAAGSSISKPQLVIERHCAVFIA
jgi:hypothetical protein